MKDASGPITVEVNTFIILPRDTTKVLTGTRSSFFPISIDSQKIEGPRMSIIPQEARDADQLDASINWFPAKHRDPVSGWSKRIVSKVVTNKNVDVYVRGWMDFGNDTVLSECQKFMNFGLPPLPHQIS